MDTLTAYLSNTAHITRSLERERVAATQATWRESFGHPAHKQMLMAHEARVNEFYGRSMSRTAPATPEQLAELVSAVTSYRPPKKYKPRSSRLTDERLLQIAVEAAERKAS